MPTQATTKLDAALSENAAIQVSECRQQRVHTRAQPLPAFFRRSLTKYYPLPQHANLQLKQDIKNAATLSAHTHAEHAALTQSLPQIREQAWQRGAATIATWSYIALRGLKLAWVRHLAWPACEAVLLGHACVPCVDAFASVRPSNEKKRMRPCFSSRIATMSWMMTTRHGGSRNATSRYDVAGGVLSALHNAHGPSPTSWCFQAQLEELRAQQSRDEARVADALATEKEAARDLEVAVKELAASRASLEALAADNAKLRKEVRLRVTHASTPHR